MYNGDAYYLYTENWKTLTEIKGLICVGIWFRRLRMIKMSILSKLILRFRLSTTGSRYQPQTRRSKERSRCQISVKKKSILGEAAY